MSKPLNKIDYYVTVHFKPLLNCKTLRKNHLSIGLYFGEVGIYLVINKYFKLSSVRMLDTCLNTFLLIRFISSRVSIKISKECFTYKRNKHNKIRQQSQKQQ